MEDELTYAREFWKVKRIIRCVRRLDLHRRSRYDVHSYTQQEVYDLAWSPDGEMLIAGSTDNTARVIRVSDGTFTRLLRSTA